MLAGGKTIHSRAYTRAKKTNSRTITTQGDFFEVEYFAIVDDQPLAVCRRLVLTEQPLAIPRRALWEDASTFLNNIFKRVHVPSPYAPCEVVPVTARLQGPLPRVLDYVCCFTVN